MNLRHIFVGLALTLTGAAGGFWLGRSSSASPNPAGREVRFEQAPAKLPTNANDTPMLAQRDELPALKTTGPRSNSSVMLLPPTAIAAPAASVPLVTGMQPIASLANVGKATARAAHETRAWAGMGADTAMLNDTMVFPPETQAKAAELFAQMSDAIRAQYLTPENLLAAAFAGVSGGPDLIGTQVLREQVGAHQEAMDPKLRSDASYRTLRVQNQYSNGTVREVDVVYQQGPDGWREVIQPNAVAKAAALLGKRPAPPK